MDRNGSDRIPKGQRLSERSAVFLQVVDCDRATVYLYKNIKNHNKSVKGYGHLLLPRLRMRDILYNVRNYRLRKFHAQ